MTCFRAAANESIRDAAPGSLSLFMFNADAEFARRLADKDYFLL